MTKKDRHGIFFSRYGETAPRRKNRQSRSRSFPAHPWDGLAFRSGRFIVTRDPADLRCDAFAMIPQGYWDEMAKLLVENHKLTEINLSFKLPEEIFHLCVSQFARRREKGVKFTCVSDLHRAPYNAEKRLKTEQVLTEYGFTENDFSLPRFRR